MVRESRPSFRSPTGRGTPLNGVQRRFEACREHDAWHKAMCKRNIANMVVSADHARKEGGKLGCLSNNNIPKKTNYSFGKGLSLFLNRSRHPPCSCSSVDQSRRVLTLWSWVRIPPGARDPYEYADRFVPSCGSVEWWQSGRMRLSRKQQGCKPPEVRILPTPRTPHENRSHEGVYRGLAGVPVLKTLAWMVGRAAKAQSC